MGNWQLEVFRMALYIGFPVGVFHYFNTVETTGLKGLEKIEQYMAPKHIIEENNRIMKEYFEKVRTEVELKKQAELEKEYMEKIK